MTGPTTEADGDRASDKTEADSDRTSDKTVTDSDMTSAVGLTGDLRGERCPSRKGTPLSMDFFTRSEDSPVQCANAHPRLNMHPTQVDLGLRPRTLGTRLDGGSQCYGEWPAKIRTIYGLQTKPVATNRIGAARGISGSEIKANIIAIS